MESLFHKIPGLCSRNIDFKLMWCFRFAFFFSLWVFYYQVRGVGGGGSSTKGREDRYRAISLTQFKNEYSNKLKSNGYGQAVFSPKQIDLNGSNLASKASPV